MPSKKLVLKDRIYGKYEIYEPVLIELIKSPPVERLKNISQFGPPAKYYHIKPFSRYEHSLGVMLLLKSLGATLEEQVAGLLHDVSHTAFSHVVDWVVGSNEKENYQDKLHGKFFANSEIKTTLAKNGVDAKKIANYKNYKLLERNIPELCADRIDYSLREFPTAIAKKCFAGLSVHKNRIIFNDSRTALLFADNFLHKQESHWGSYEAGARYINLARILKLAIERKHISFEDLSKDDNYVVKKLEAIKDKEIKRVLGILTKKNLSGIKKDTFLFKKKFRYVDPSYLDKGKIKVLSAEDKKYKIKIKKASMMNKKGVRLPII
jgi:hypothetical protein